jgi:Transposase DDE domain
MGKIVQATAVASQGGWGKEPPHPRSSEALVPFKANAARRHHIPKQRHRVTNWRAYDASLRQRGSLTVWFTEEAIAAWRAEPRTTRGGQPWYSPLAILTALTLRAVFRLALRQTEGLIGSILHLLGLDLAVPDHSTLSRRAETLEVPRPRSSPGSGPVHLLVDSTGLRLGGPANGWSRSMAQRPVGPGASYTWARMPGPAGSRPWR